MLTIAALALLAACISILAHDNHQTRKALKHMSQSLDALKAAAVSLQETSANVQAAVAMLQAAQGTPDSALDPITAQINGAVSTLNAAIAPKA